MLIRFLLFLIFLCAALLFILPSTVQEAKLKRKCFLGLTITLSISVVLLAIAIFYFQDPLIQGQAHSELILKKVQKTADQKNLLALSNYDFKNLSETDIRKTLQYQDIHHLRVSNLRTENVPLILAFLKHGQHIQHFEILFSDITILQALFENLHTTSKLESLNIRNSYINQTITQGLTQFLLKQPHLKELKLTELSLKTSSDLQGLQEYLSQKPALHSISFNNNQLSDAAIMPLLEKLINLPELQYLDLSNNQLQDASLQFLAQYLALKPATLRALNLSDNNLTSTGITALLPYITAHSSLQTLDLRRNPLDDQGIQLLKQQTKNHSSLQSIFITPSNLSKDTQEMIY